MLDLCFTIVILLKFLILHFQFVIKLGMHGWHVPHNIYLCLLSFLTIGSALSRWVRKPYNHFIVVTPEFFLCKKV